MSADPNIIYVTAYLRRALDADKIKQFGVSDLMVLIASGRVRLTEAVGICDEPPLVQLAVCDVVRESSFNNSLRGIADLIQDHLIEGQNLFGSIYVNLSTARLHHQDLQKAAKVKEHGVPDLIVLLDKEWATLDEVAASCEEQLETQREACRLVWSHNQMERGAHNPKLLSKAIQQIKG